MGEEAVPEIGGDGADVRRGRVSRDTDRRHVVGRATAADAPVVFEDDALTGPREQNLLLWRWRNNPANRNDFVGSPVDVAAKLNVLNGPDGDGGEFVRRAVGVADGRRNRAGGRWGDLEANTLVAVGHRRRRISSCEDDDCTRYRVLNANGTAGSAEGEGLLDAINRARVIDMVAERVFDEGLVAGDDIARVAAGNDRGASDVDRRGLDIGAIDTVDIKGRDVEVTDTGAAYREARPAGEVLRVAEDTQEVRARGGNANTKVAKDGHDLRAVDVVPFLDQRRIRAAGQEVGHAREGVRGGDGLSTYAS